MEVATLRHIKLELSETLKFCDASSLNLVVSKTGQQVYGPIET
ncbi:hypothetical protein D1BOALGB6SA_5015 [Olavius sp. associated proteobacterium Delta 1]|nr:hypothetical protein D1BOALGB6SA_5015 [Olavius sp. associated proteobacterium Delta 1]